MARYGYVDANGFALSLPLRRPGEIYEQYMTRLSNSGQSAFRTLSRDLGVDLETAFQSIDEE